MGFMKSKTLWLIDETILDQFNINLVHGNDNFNKVSKKKLLIFPRTEEKVVARYEAEQCNQ